MMVSLLLTIYILCLHIKMGTKNGGRRLKKFSTSNINANNLYHDFLCNDYGIIKQTE